MAVNKKYISRSPDFMFFNKKKIGRIRMILTLKIDFERQNFAIFKARFRIESQMCLLKYERAHFQSINSGFDAEVSEKIRGHP